MYGFSFTESEGVRDGETTVHFLTILPRPCALTSQNDRCEYIQNKQRSALRHYHTKAGRPMAGHTFRFLIILALIYYVLYVIVECRSHLFESFAASLLALLQTEHGSPFRKLMPNKMRQNWHIQKL